MPHYLLSPITLITMAILVFAIGYLVSLFVSSIEKKERNLAIATGVLAVAFSMALLADIVVWFNQVLYITF